MKTTQIGWTESTWNPWIGCTKVSPGCKHCYMMTFRERVGQDPTVVTRTTPATFNAPLKWKQPRQVFTCSWSDFYHEVADLWRNEAWDIIARTRHLYQILTKRPERMQLHTPMFAPDVHPRVWLGVSVESQDYVERIEPLQAMADLNLFLSVEPLLGPVDLRGHLQGIGWVIVGGESGKDFRPMQVEWAEGVVAACEAADVPVYMKQDSALRSGQRGRLSDALWKHKWTPPLPLLLAP